MFDSEKGNPLVFNLPPSFSSRWAATRAPIQLQMPLQTTVVCGQVNYPDTLTFLQAVVSTGLLYECRGRVHLRIRLTIQLGRPSNEEVDIRKWGSKNAGTKVRSLQRNIGANTLTSVHAGELRLSAQTQAESRKRRFMALDVRLMDARATREMASSCTRHVDPRVAPESRLDLHLPSGPCLQTHDHA